MENGKGASPDKMLASYGADRSRWARAGYVVEGQGSPEAEAEALHIDKLLDLASRPTVPEGALARMLAELPAAQPATVIAFPPRKTGRTPFFRYAALPLAASLALGIYLGAQGDLDLALPTAITGAVALGDDPADDLGGVGELDAYAEDNVT